MTWWMLGLIFIAIAVLAWLIPALIFGYALGGAFGDIARSTADKAKGDL